MLQDLTLACLCLCLSLSALAYADITGTVVEVDDGDTVQIKNADSIVYTVQLRCADAPELGQDAGEASAAYLARLIANKSVTVAWEVVNQSGQVSGTIMLRGSDINFRMIRAGYAWHDADDRCGPAWDTAQRRAQESGRGLWSAPEPIPPWDYRSL
ncbi:MAG: thermonuclease family protein [Halieaceae bacterium]